MPMMTQENTKRSMKMQVAEVSRPLASVKRICEAGHVVVFDEDGSFLFNKMTGEINQLREESGNYMFDVWIPPESTTTSLSQAVTIGYLSSRIRPINMSRHAVGQKSGRDGADQEDEYDEEVICGQCDKPPCEGCYRPPNADTKRDRRALRDACAP